MAGRQHRDLGRLVTDPRRGHPGDGDLRLPTPGGLTTRTGSHADGATSVPDTTNPATLMGGGVRRVTRVVGVSDP
ncbi:hypothetical protein GCM10022415_24480 [Knoellia locipacati]|uniref:Uncharacterized protein n=1 Tax=Knoellia locipacati TaxID=882824 RepID=A0A512T2E2_9MICO|nr:hypothetical protein KLO01_24440 [Knoellia locipacati]